MKRILSVQSHVVSGYVGNKSATFPLQLHGFEVDAVNSVQLSNHTGYANGHPGQILNDSQLRELVDGLKSNDIASGYSHIISGYIGCDNFLLEMAETVRQLKKVNPEVKYVCDPVLGDTEPGMYVPEELVPIYRDAILPLADIVLPNQFEAQKLTGISIRTESDALKAMKIIQSKGVETVILSSAELSDNESLISLAMDKNQTVKIEIPKLPASFVGTGDLFTALTTIWLHETCGNLTETMERVVATMQSVLKRTLDFAGIDNVQNPHKMELKLIQSKREIENPRVTIKASTI